MLTVLVSVACISNRSGGNYAGNETLTRSGRLCQRWDDPAQPHTAIRPGMLPDSSLSAANNFCRSPGFDPGGPWCYVLDGDVTWEYCDLPACSEIVGKSLLTNMTSPHVNLIEQKRESGFFFFFFFFFFCFFHHSLLLQIPSISVVYYFTIHRLPWNVLG